MIYTDFQGTKLSMLGFGMMRLPLIEGTKNVDEDAACKLVDYAMENGVNYFDTAYSYLNGYSEIITGKALKKYPRDSYYLATKFPGHQVFSSYDPAPLFEDQLKKCDVDYFDFYLLHNVSQISYDTYMDPKWGIIDYFVEQKKLGRIKHLGFSTHAKMDYLEKFLDYAGDKMEFCQIQLNYLDWTMQDAKAKCELLKAHNIPIWVMEPVRGGRLAKLSQEHEDALKAMRPDESIAAWSFRWLQDIADVRVILSGMSNMAQVEDNIKTFSDKRPLSDAERKMLADIADELKSTVPCTSCKYCTTVCPQELDIPWLMNEYNEICVAASLNVRMAVDAMPPEKHPSMCLGCGACMEMCPQNIKIPEVLSDLTERLKTIPSWVELSREREKAAEIERKNRL